ncbi:YfhO family protein [bacterium]|nr:YfhO family protein [Candidatus Omnitrophota bacterium]MBU2528599.1 YfhO family protein [bacterium]MBU4122792.1 YfhO family protein [bacterium]
MKNKLSLGIVAVIILAAVLIFFRSIVFSSLTFFMRDTIIQFFPWSFFKSACLRQGIIPFWNPFSHCGMPFAAAMQPAVYYPPNIIFYVLNFVSAYKIYIVFHIFIAFISMFLLMRETGLDEEESFLSGMIFAFNGYILTKIEFLSVLGTSVWLPAAFLILMKSRSRTDFKRISALALVFAFQFLAGHPQILFYELFALFLYCTAVFFFTEQKQTKPFLTLTLSGILALMIAAVQFIPSLEFVLNSIRGRGLPGEIVMTNSFSLGMFINFFNPFLRYSSNDWPYGCYVGIIAFMLFLFSVKSSSRSVKFYLSLFVISIFVALGANNPVFGFIIKAFPFLKAFRYPATILYLSVFAVAASAGYALGALRVSKKIKILLVFAVFIELFITGQKFNNKLDKRIFTVYCDKINFLRKQDGFFRYFVSPKTTAARTDYDWSAWKDNLYGDTGLPFGLYNAAGQNIELTDYNEFSRRLYSSGNADKAQKLLSIMSVRFLLADYKIESEQWKLSFENPKALYNVRIYENKAFLPRVYFADKAKVLTKDKILDYMESDAFNPRDEVVLQKEVRATTENVNIGKIAKAVITEDIINEISVTVYAPRDAWLVMTDAFYPGWKASVDGKKTEILKANYFQRAVFVPEGSHIVKFSCRPLSFVAGFVITVLSLIFILYKRLPAPVKKPGRI